MVRELSWQRTLIISLMVLLLMGITQYQYRRWQTDLIQTLCEIETQESDPDPDCNGD
jgi:hypothetical protein